MESNKRSLLKTISWQFVHVGFVYGLIYAFTREWEYAGLGAIAYIAWESCAYYIHERVWARFSKKIK